jgi:hypothetical protein
MEPAHARRQGTMIEKDRLFAIPKRRKKSELLETLDHAFDQMPPKVQRAVFLQCLHYKPREALGKSVRYQK